LLSIILFVASEVKTVFDCFIASA